ncbi:MAG: hypothetical protein ACJAVF_004155 [Paraglaciecola sp.]
MRCQKSEGQAKFSLSEVRGLNILFPEVKRIAVSDF